jgi:hypothetical protein
MMRLGKVKVSTYLIAEALHFPSDWEIENPDVVLIISGKDFPKCDDSGPKECRISVTRHELDFKVEEI